MYAAGDSTMQGIDSFLADELGRRLYVRSDSRPGSGISRGVYWKYHAMSQTKRLRQRATVFSVGAASDGLPIPTALGVLADLLRRAVDPGVRQPRARRSCRPSCAAAARASSG